MKYLEEIISVVRLFGILLFHMLQVLNGTQIIGFTLNRLYFTMLKIRKKSFLISKHLMLNNLQETFQKSHGKMSGPILKILLEFLELMKLSLILILANQRN